MILLSLLSLLYLLFLLFDYSFFAISSFFVLPLLLLLLLFKLVVLAGLLLLTGLLLFCLKFDYLCASLSLLVVNSVPRTFLSLLTYYSLGKLLSTLDLLFFLL